jgi:hypothetical protein
LKTDTPSAELSPEPVCAGDAFAVSGIAIHGASRGPVSQAEGEFVWLPQFPHPLRRPLRALVWIVKLAFGLIALCVALAFLATLPALNLLVLGYLLAAEGRVARSGKLYQIVPLLPAVIRLASIGIAAGACLVPVWFIARSTADAQLVAPDSRIVGRWGAALVVATILAATHIVLAVSRGGTPSSFFHPVTNFRLLAARLRSGEFWPGADRALREFVGGFEWLRLCRLGIVAFVGTWVWLIVPTGFFSAAGVHAGSWRGPALLLWGASLVPVLGWVPMLQVRLAVEDRWRAAFELRSIWQMFSRAPLAWLVAMTLLYASSIPLFLYTAHVKLHIPTQDIWWDVTLVSIICSLPARALLGWAYSRAVRRPPAWWGLVWFSRITLACLMVLYVWLLSHVPLTIDVAAWRLQHHVLVLPIPGW